MPSQELSFRTQKAVLWTRAGFDDYGRPTVNSPIELKVRWEDGKRQDLGPLASPVAVDATVTVDREIEIGSMLRKGAKTTMPSPVDKIHEVVDYVEIPDVKGRVAERVVLLRRFAESLPTIV